MPDLSRFDELILGKILDTLSEEETEELHAMLEESPELARLVESWTQPEAIAEYLAQPAEMNTESLDNKVFTALRASVRRESRQKIRRIVARVSVAAITLLVIGVIWMKHSPGKQAPLAAHTPFPFEIPHTNPDIKNQLLETSRKVDRPQAKLSPDCIFDLDTFSINKPKRFEYFNIVKTGEGELAYVGNNTLHATADKDSTYNMISIPATSPSWQISLPDGSIADLKPGSALSFFYCPSGAPLKQRRVILHGGATFAVAHNDNSPFILETDSMEMNDIGTIFSINPDGQTGGVTVIVQQGSVTINTGHDKKQLDSAYEGRIDNAFAHIDVTTHPLSAAQQWHLPMFDFSQQNVLSVVKQLAIWYGGYKISYESGIDTVTLGKLGKGHIAKDFSATLPDLLHALETPDIHFTISNRYRTIRIHK